MRRVPFTLRGASASALGLVATQAVGFVVEFAVARRLGASGLGVLAVGTGLGAMFGATIVTAFASAASAQVARSDALDIPAAVGGHLRLAVRLSLAAASVAMVVLLAGAAPLSVLLTGSTDATPVIAIFAIALPFQAAGGVAVAVALALGRPSTEIAYRWTEAAVRALTVIVLFLGFNIVVVAFVHLLAVVTSAPIGLRAAFRAAGPATGTVRHELAEVLSLAGWQTLATGAWLAARRLDVLIVSAFLGASAAGAYRLASVVASLAGVVMLALQPVFLPVAARRLAASGGAGLGDHYRRVTRFAMIASAPIAAALIFGRERILSFFGAPFEVAGPALVILAVSQAVLATGGHSTTVVQIGGARMRAALNTLLGAGIQVGALFLLVPVFGIAGAAWATVVGVTSTHLLQLRTMAKTLGVTLVDEGWLRAAVLIAGLLVASAAVDLIVHGQAWLKVGLFAVSVVVYAIFALQAVVPVGERQLLGAVLRRRGEESLNL